MATRERLSRGGSASPTPTAPAGAARILRWSPPDPAVDAVPEAVAQAVHRDAEPGCLLDPAWIRAHAGDWDAVHLHLGLDGCDPDQVGDAVRTHRLAGTPVAVTAHDLEVPDRSVSVADLLRRIRDDVAAVVAPTAACAIALERRIGRPVRVVPHGPVLPAHLRERLRAHRRRRAGRRHHLLVGGSLPRQLGWVEAVEATTRTVLSVPLRILVDDDRLDGVRRAVAPYPGVCAQPMPTGPDRSAAAIGRAVAEAESLVLPLRWGGHSWLLELAADVGTPVVATDVGFLAAQQPVRTARCADGHIDVDDLARALEEEVTADVAVHVTPSGRIAAESARDDGHRRLYRWLALGGWTP